VGSTAVTLELIPPVTPERAQPGQAHADPPPRSRITHDGTVLSSADDSGIRWRPGERLEQLFEARCDALSQEGRADTPAVDGPDGSLTYGELDARANQLARCLAARGAAGPGERVALLLERPLDGYVAMLAVHKLGAAYVPVDAAFPVDRLAYIIADAGCTLVLTSSRLAPQLPAPAPDAEVICVDLLAAELLAQDPSRPDPAAQAEPDDLAYVIYTSGSTGRPKGVAVLHSSICNFVRVAAQAYGVRGDDRVYQGLTIAFDFVVEEIWPAWMAGATLVPKPAGTTLLGDELLEFLDRWRVTALCCVPTLLATVERDLPALRLLLLSGEPCPPDLAARWHRPGRHMLNVYGPTEATVTATWTVLEPGRPVTIGVPLPTYSIVILSPDCDRALPLHEPGEIAIAGIGLADGYIGLPERTARAFVPDFIGLDDNPSGRIYRTGDLGRVNADGELEHLGRIDDQVKIRGYRIELGEIEALLRSEPGIAQAVVATVQTAPGIDELAAYYTVAADGPEIDPERVLAHLRELLPPYMVPVALQPLAQLPTMPSGKVDRRLLPAPSVLRPAAATADHVAPTSALESTLADELQRLLGTDRVSVTSDFFAELGTSSLVMARYSARLRERGDLPPVSIRDIYLHPTVRALATAIADGEPGPAVAPAGDGPALPAPIGTPRPLLCGALQLVAALIYAGVFGVAFDAGASWLNAANSILSAYGRAVAIGSITLLVAGLLPIAAKWILIGRFTPRRIRIWSLAYLRFWIVKTLLAYNPMARLLSGTSLHGLYLRALGARIGAGATILTRHEPIATDLLSVGAGSIVRRETWCNGYRAVDGVIEFGSIEIGAHAIVGEQTVLDINTQIGDHAQLGHCSSLHAGQTIGAGERWHGSPARPAPAGTDFRLLRPSAGGAARRHIYGAGKLVASLATLGALEAALAALLVSHRWVHGVSELDVLGLAAIVTLALPVAALIVALTVPRTLSRLLTPGRVYPLYGLHWMVQRTVSRTSNISTLTALFGDSSLIVGYLRLLGHHFGLVHQTGTNFGTEVKQEVPALTRIGTGTMVSDGLSVSNVEVSADSFRVMPVSIGAGCYLGNTVIYPPGARIGDDCLLATKVMLPLDGPERTGIGLLGSPAFEIPRSVRRDTELVNAELADPLLPRRLARKLRHNLVTIALYLFVRFLVIAGLLSVAFAPLGGAGLRAWPGTLASIAIDVTFPLVVFMIAELALTRARRRPPELCSIYDRAFWRHERYWKVPEARYLAIFNGTPLKGPVLRLLGVKVGRRLFDDGSAIVEHTLLSIGDDCTLNAFTTLQAHSLEEGAFKSGPIVLGDRCTLGTGAYVHYCTEFGDGAELGPDSFLMKGSQVGALTRWMGNPALESAPQTTSSQPPAVQGVR
jgi:non-ribosomal peptide synthetase-like protein